MSNVSKFLIHFVAGCLLATALAHGWAANASQEWPLGPDVLRDLGAAETVRLALSGANRADTGLPDPNYRGEVFWYGPLVPAIIGGSAYALGQPVNIVATRAAVFLNILGPLTFYLLIARWWGPLEALVALAIVLYGMPGPSWLTATYSPALNVSSVAQPFCYLGLLALTAWGASEGRFGLLGLTGGMAGLAFLAHPAPAAILGSVTVVSAAWSGATRRSAIRRLAPVLLVATVALVIASPGFIPLAHYGGDIKNVRPFIWTDPSMTPDRMRAFLWANVKPGLLSVSAALGILFLIGDRRNASRQVVTSVAFCTLLLFAWSGYLARVVPIERLASLSIAPPHHFLIYLRALEAAFAAVGMVRTIRCVFAFLQGRQYVDDGERDGAAAWLPNSLWRGSDLWPLAACAALAALLIYGNRESYRRRDADMSRPAYSPEQWATTEWIRTHTTRRDVFLAPENTGLSMLGIVGRRTVIVDPFMSNPYVDWESRDRDRVAMWHALEVGDCGEWVRATSPYGVSHVLGIDGLTPPVREGTCGLEVKYSAGPFLIYGVR